MQPTVSVIVPVHNGAATIASCIEALLGQTYPSHLTEIIVVDNNSTDGTPELVSRYPITLIYEREIQTSYAARNRGIGHARGEIVALTDADCTPLPDWLERLIEPFADAAAGAVLGTVADNPAQSAVEELMGLVKPFAHPDRRGLKSLITGNAAIRHSVLTEVGLFDERLPTGGDTDFGWRMQLQTALKIVDAPEAVVLHRHRARLSEVFRQFRRYGLSEVLLTTLYHGSAGSITGRGVAWRMADQCRALLTYVASLTLRFILWPWRRLERHYFLRPLFLMAVESGNIIGKLDGLLSTRCYRRNPYAGSRAIARTPLANRSAGGPPAGPLPPALSGVEGARRRSA